MADDNEVLLPRATIQKMVKEFVTADVRVAGELIDMLVTCCTEFVQLVYSEANEVSARDKKKTINPEHVLKALTDLGFGRYVEEVSATWEEHKEAAKTTHSQKLAMRKTGAEQAGLTEEQQVELQQQMFAAARAQSMTSADAAATMQAAYQQQLALQQRVQGSVGHDSQLVAQQGSIPGAGSGGGG